MSASAIHFALPSPAHTLQQLCAAGTLPGEVLCFQEDFSQGPLADCDLIDPQARMGYWNAVLWAQDWWPQQDEDFVHAYWASRKAQLKAFERRVPLYAWAGGHAGEWLMLCMLAEHAHADTPLYHVAVPQDGRRSCMGIQPPQALPALFAGARLLTAAEREQLAAQWRYWQEHGDGIRYLDAHGALQQHPIDHYDNALVNAIKVAGKWPVARLVGEVMGREEQAWLSDSFLFWRVKKLVDAGVLKRENVPGAMPVICHW